MPTASAKATMRRIASSSPKTGRASDHAAVSWRLAAMNGCWCSSITSMFSQWTMAMAPRIFATCRKTEKIWSSLMPWMPLGEISRPL